MIWIPVNLWTQPPHREQGAQQVISLSCLADSRPPALITWYQLTPNKQVSKKQGEKQVNNRKVFLCVVSLNFSARPCLIHWKVVRWKEALPSIQLRRERGQHVNCFSFLGTKTWLLFVSLSLEKEISIQRMIHWSSHSVVLVTNNFNFSACAIPPSLFNHSYVECLQFKQLFKSTPMKYE